MAPNAFDDASAPPRPDEVAATLGAAAVHWDDLRRRVAAKLGPVTEQWGFTSRSTGWGLRLRLGDRIIAYLSPRTGHFLVSFVLGEKAVQAAHADGLPAPVLALIDASRRYAEGRGVRFEVRSADDVSTAVDLALIKAGRRAGGHPQAARHTVQARISPGEPGPGSKIKPILR